MSRGAARAVSLLASVVPGSESGALPLCAASITSCQIIAGRLPPITLFIVFALSLPTHTPPARCADVADEPGVAEILTSFRSCRRRDGRRSAARLPVPDTRRSHSSMSFIAPTCAGVTACCGAGRVTRVTARGRTTVRTRRIDVVSSVARRWRARRRLPSTRAASAPTYRAPARPFAQIRRDAETAGRRLPLFARPHHIERAATVLIDWASASRNVHGAAIAAIVVARAPAADPERQIVGDVSGVKPLSSAAR